MSVTLREGKGNESWLAGTHTRRGARARPHMHMASMLEEGRLSHSSR